MHFENWHTGLCGPWFAELLSESVWEQLGQMCTLLHVGTLLRSRQSTGRETTQANAENNGGGELADTDIRTYYPQPHLAVHKLAEKMMGSGSMWPDSLSLYLSIHSQWPDRGDMHRLTSIFSRILGLPCMGRALHQVLCPSLCECHWVDEWLLRRTLQPL